MNKINKTQLVFQHLKERGCITSIEAIEKYGATRLSAIIFRLRQRGYKIDTIDIPFTDRFGHKSICAKYVYKG